MATQSCSGLQCPYHPDAGMSWETDTESCRCNFVNSKGERCTVRKRPTVSSPQRGKPLKGWRIK